jgi:transcriptional enhancer factor
MYQEVQSSAGPRMPFIRRAILVWTFHKTREGEGNGTNWRYLDHHPPRRLCMSPSPHPSHHVSAAMNENFNSWTDTPLHLQHPSMLDPFGPGLVTPPHTAGLQSPFAAPGSNYFGQGFDLPLDENISFASSTTCTVDSESTLVDDTASNIDHFLSNTNVHLADYGHNGTTWQLPQTESFDADPAWANYNVAASTPAIGWDTSDAKNNSWNEGPDTKQLHWDPQDDTPIKHDWTVPEVGSSPSKGRTDYIDQSIEQKLLPWIDEHNEINETQKEYTNVAAERVAEDNADGAGLGISTKASQEHDLVAVEDGFDYAELAERLK